LEAIELAATSMTDTPVEAGEAGVEKADGVEVSCEEDEAVEEEEDEGDDDEEDDKEDDDAGVGGGGGLARSCFRAFSSMGNPWQSQPGINDTKSPFKMWRRTMTSFRTRLSR
jgi:hypothetical protein